jgi:hypothetical protein
MKAAIAARRHNALSILHPDLKHCVHTINPGRPGVLKDMLTREIR